jgi:hypothetical protein
VPKPLRYYYVRSPASNVAHLSYARMEGDKTFCGRRMRKGWFWVIGARNIGKNRSICLQCRPGGIESLK